MSAKKRKESVEKKQDTEEPKIDKEFENLHEKIASEIEVESAEQNETKEEPTEEDLLEKERKKAMNMEERYLRVNAEFENYKKRMIRESSDRFK